MASKKILGDDGEPEITPKSMMEAWQGVHRARIRREVVALTNRTVIRSLPWAFPTTVAAPGGEIHLEMRCALPHYRPTEFCIPWEVAEFFIVQNLQIGNIENCLNPIDGIHFSDTSEPTHRPVKFTYDTMTCGNRIFIRLLNRSPNTVTLNAYLQGIYTEEVLFQS